MKQPFRTFLKRVLYPLFILALLLYPIYIMADVWGLMPKSQIDPQLIEEMVDTKIAAHDADPDAHSSDGAALDLHRKNGILDHLAGSIVADKLSSAQNMVFVPVNDASALNVDNASFAGYGYLSSIFQHSGESGVGQADLFEIDPADYGYDNGDVVFDFIASHLATTGTAVSEMYFSFARIQFKNGNYKTGYFDGTWHDSAWTAFDVSKQVKYRIFFDAVAGHLHMFAGQTEILDVAYTMNFEFGELFPHPRTTRGTSTSSTLYFGNILFHLGSTI